MKTPRCHSGAFLDYEINNQKHKKRKFLKSTAKLRKICEMSKKNPDFVKSTLQNYKIYI